MCVVITGTLHTGDIIHTINGWKARGSDIDTVANHMVCVCLSVCLCLSICVSMCMCLSVYVLASVCMSLCVLCECMYMCLSYVYCVDVGVHTVI